MGPRRILHSLIAWSFLHIPDNAQLGKSRQIGQRCAKPSDSPPSIGQFPSENDAEVLGEKPPSIRERALHAVPALPDSLCFEGPSVDEVARGPWGLVKLRIDEWGRTAGLLYPPSREAAIGRPALKLTEPPPLNLISAKTSTPWKLRCLPQGTFGLRNLSQRSSAPPLGLHKEGGIGSRSAAVASNGSSAA